MVSFDFLDRRLDRRRAERFAELLDEPNDSPRYHSHQDDEDLAELVAVGRSLSTARPGVEVDHEFRAGLRAMLVATAERDGIGVTATAAEAETEPGARGPGRGIPWIGSARRLRVRGAIVASIAASAIAVSGISTASENASPGDALYGIKRSTERAQLAMSGSDVSRGRLFLDFARTRLTEAGAMPGNDSAFSVVLDDMDADTRQGVKLLTGSAVARKDAAPLATVDGFVADQRDTFAPIIDRLSPGNRFRAASSLALLDAVSRRTKDLRVGLACAGAVPGVADSLGPWLSDCPTGSDPSTLSGKPSGPGQPQGGKSTGTPHNGSTQPVRPDPTSPAGGPDPTRQAVLPGVPQLPLPVLPVSRSPSPAPTSAPATAVADGDEGVLGGILGGILGS